IVKIIDNGPGIPEDQQGKIFDPFFTTKEIGRGTGLGLWISYDITEKLGGTIHLSSREGEGTIFTIQIPVVHPEKK
ncbi:MAG: sensor histidine kinase, partial [Desulfobacterales bacterium]